jgi:K(+)-stimulated pyrophosphate-energized sodium pump
VGTTAKCYTQSLAVAASSVACFLLLSLFVEEVWAATPGDDACRPDVHSPLLYLGAVFGLLVVLAFGWMTLRRILVSGRDLLNELRVQLGAQRERAGSGTPERMAPGLAPEDRLRIVGARSASESDAEAGQLACVEIVSRIALRGMLTPALVGVGFPLLVGVALRLLASADDLATPAEALAALLLVAIFVGALGSLLFIYAGGAWDNAKKYVETGAHGGRFLVRAASAHLDRERASTAAEVNNPTWVAAAIGDTIGDPLRGAVGPATQALLKTLIALTLVFLPFFL